MTTIATASEGLAATLATLGKGPFLTAPLHAEGRPIGVFLVDRRWQPNPHRDLDESALRTFAQLAAQAIAQYDLRTREARKEDEEQLASVAIFIDHEFSDPVHEIGVCMIPLEKAIREGNSTEALDKVDSIRTRLQSLELSHKGLNSLVGKPVLETVSLKSIFDEACRGNHRDDFPILIDCPDDLCIFGDEGELRICFQELIRNSQYWLKQSKKPRSDLFIDISAGIPGVMAIPPALDPGQKYALVHFQDTGDGINPTSAPRIFDLGFSTRPQGERPGERGVGLFMVRRIVGLHKGMILSCGTYGEGAHFAVFLPLSIPLL